MDFDIRKPFQNLKRIICRLIRRNTKLKKIRPQSLLFAIPATLISSATSMSSVGGPLTELLIAILAMWAVGLYEIWSNRLGLLGSIGSIVFAFIGGAVGLAIGSQVMDTTLSMVHFEGSLARSNHPLLYILSTAMVITTVLASWSAVQIIVLIRNRRYGAPDNA